MKNHRFFAVLLSLVALAMASENATDSYPEHGKVVAVRTSTTSDTKPVYTDSYGKTRGGGSYDFTRFVFKIETTDRVYEFTGGRRQDFQVGDEVQFRISKRTAYVVLGHKEQRYAITGEELPQRGHAQVRD